VYSLRASASNERFEVFAAHPDGPTDPHVSEPSAVAEGSQAREGTRPKIWTVSFLTNSAAVTFAR
jgi:hypothetical protein